MKNNIEYTYKETSYLDKRLKYLKDRIENHSEEYNNSNLALL